MASWRFRALPFLPVMLLWCAPALAPWQDNKPIAQWTREDIQRFMTRSPWVREVNLPSGQSLLADPAQAGRRAVASLPPMPVRPVETPILLRWESAPLMREVAAQRKLTLAPAADLDTFYVLSAAGLLSRILDLQGPPATTSSIHELLRALGEAATLRAGSNPPMRCERLDWSVGRTPVRFYFRRNPQLPIVASDGDVVFETTLGGTSRLSAKFRLKDMIWNGTLAL